MKKKRISSLILSLTILISSISGLAITSSAAEPANRLTQSYKNTEYASYIVPADTIPAGAGYQQVEYIVNTGGNQFTIDKGYSSNNFVINCFGLNGNIVKSVNASGVSILPEYNSYNYTVGVNYPIYSFLSLTLGSNSVSGCYYYSSNISGTKRYSIGWHSSFSHSFKSDSAPTANLFINNYNPYNPISINMASSSSSSGTFEAIAHVYYLAEVDIDGTIYDQPVNIDASVTITANKGGGNLSNNLIVFDSSSTGQTLFNISSDGYNLVPCYRISDGRIGLYDTKHSKFYLPSSYNASNLYAGPDVVGVTAPVITGKSNDYSIYFTGASPQLYVTATTEIGSLSYQWQRSDPTPLGYSSWTNISDATSRTYTPPTFLDLGIYKFRCVVSSSVGSTSLSTTSGEIKVTVVEADPDIPVITTQPQGGTYYDNVDINRLVVEVAPPAEGTITYQWQERIDNIWYDIQGATNNTYLPPVRGEVGDYFYRCNISNTFYSVTKALTSDEVSVKVIPYNSFEDFWRIFFNGGLGSITDVTSGINNITNNFPIEPGGTNQFIQMVGALYNSVVPGWFSTYIAILFLALGIIVVLRGAGF